MKTDYEEDNPRHVSPGPDQAVALPRNSSAHTIIDLFGVKNKAGLKELVANECRA